MVYKPTFTSLGGYHLVWTVFPFAELREVKSQDGDYQLSEAFSLRNWPSGRPNSQNQLMNPVDFAHQIQIQIKTQRSNGPWPVQ